MFFGQHSNLAERFGVFVMFTNSDRQGKSSIESWKPKLLMLPEGIPGNAQLTCPRQL